MYVYVKNVLSLVRSFVFDGHKSSDFGFCWKEWFLGSYWIFKLNPRIKMTTCRAPCAHTHTHTSQPLIGSFYDGRRQRRRMWCAVFFSIIFSHLISPFHFETFLNFDRGRGLFMTMLIARTYALIFRHFNGFHPLAFCLLLVFKLTNCHS